MKKYFVQWCYGSLAEVKEFADCDAMLECVREHQLRYEYLPVVYFGGKLEFEPAEVIKSWKIKQKQ